MTVSIILHTTSNIRSEPTPSLSHDSMRLFVSPRALTRLSTACSRITFFPAFHKYARVSSAVLRARKHPPRRRRRRRSDSAPFSRQNVREPQTSAQLSLWRQWRLLPEGWRAEDHCSASTSRVESHRRVVVGLVCRRPRVKAPLVYLPRLMALPPDVGFGLTRLCEMTSSSNVALTDFLLAVHLFSFFFP